MKHYVRLNGIFVSILIVMITLNACHATRAQTEKSKATTLSAIAKKPAKFEGKEVQLEGLYMGWKHENCKFSGSFLTMQITRSDWVFSDGKKCCFVTGSMPPDYKTSPEQPLPIQFTAKVKSKDSKIYLELISIVK